MSFSPAPAETLPETPAPGVTADAQEAVRRDGAETPQHALFLGHRHSTDSAAKEHHSQYRKSMEFLGVVSIGCVGSSKL